MLSALQDKQKRPASSIKTKRAQVLRRITKARQVAASKTTKVRAAKRTLKERKLSHKLCVRRAAVFSKTKRARRFKASRVAFRLGEYKDLPNTRTLEEEVAAVLKRPTLAQLLALKKKRSTPTQRLRTTIRIIFAHRRRKVSRARRALRRSIYYNRKCYLHQLRGRSCPKKKNVKPLRLAV